MPVPSTPAPLAPSPPSHSNPGAVTEASNHRQIASRPSSKASQRPAAGSSAGIAGSLAPASGAPGPPSRAPLPTKQPKANTSAKTTGGSVPLPRLSAPLVDKMAMAAVISPSPTAEAPKISMTSKEWVIPPRPKPGRKPATDTPPTKRKAQNRAAQRAFRERRAARVGELEVQLDEQKDAHQQEEAKLKEKIRNLELDLQSFRSRCMLLENMLDRERQERIRAETQAETLKRRHGDDFFRSQSISGPRHSHSQPHSPVHHHTRHSLSGGRNEHLSQGRNFSISNIITPPESLDISSNNPEADAAITCGNCSPNSRCACAEEVLASTSAGCGKCAFGTACQCLDDMANNVSAGQDMKRPLSPSAGSSDNKRHRPDVDTHALTETDFTAMFSRKPAADTTPQSPYDQPPSVTQMSSEESMAFKESCGFCKDGTYCVCAEDTAGMATPAMTPTESTQPISHQTQTPPPSEPDILPPPLAMEMTADGAVKLPRRIQGKKPVHKASPSSKGGCGANGPGTCAQCQADPKSGLFCRLMNAKYSREQGSGGGCCGGKGAGGGCCKSKTQPAPEKITLPSLPSLGLSCAEAYQTLSSHRNFSKAADDISSWLPKLKTTQHGGRVTPGRQAIEVEAASIMSVLKEFDVRFGREC
ncbi:bZIP transcription factor HapX [Metarhizium anisopliae]